MCVMRRFALLIVALIFAVIGACTTQPGESHLDWSITPNEGTTTIDGLVEFTVHISSKANINSDLELTTDHVPTGVYVTLPAQATSTANEVEGSFYVLPGLELGTYQIHINVREEGTEYGNPQVFQLTVTSGGEAPDFSVEVDPSSYTMSVEGGKTFTFYVRPNHGFAGDVAISLGELPDDIVVSQGVTPATLTLPPGSGGKGGTFVLSFVPHPPVPPTVNLVVTVTGEGITHTRTITLTLPFDAGPGIGR